MKAARARGLFGSLLASSVMVLALAVPTSAGVSAIETTVPTHPLGNFTVSHYNGLTLTPERIDLLTVIDSAEIPSQQDRSDIDNDGDGELSDAELTARAALMCPQVQQDMVAQVDGSTVVWEVAGTSMEAVPGAAGLPTLRMTCDFSAEVDLDGLASVNFTDGYRTDRIGWREITATGSGIALQDPAVPSSSVSDELRSYPDDLLSSPLDVREVTLSAEPGVGNAAAAADDIAVPGFTGSDPLSRLVTAGDRQLESFMGGRELTPLLGTAALLLAVLLGAGHAVLPGHGKTVMAAYLAGRSGRPRDALIVGATVTGTHTVGVLVLGLALTISSALVGEQALRVLGITSGLLIALIGASLLRDARRARKVESTSREAALAHAHAGGHAHSHDHANHSHGGHGHSHGHSHGPGHSHSHGPGRRGLIGMGIAGGLVPSPSALVVLLGSIALGRTFFGVFLVFAYGIGMAATLTAVGLLLVKLRMRLDEVESSKSNTLATKVTAALPLFTAVLVLLVGIGLVARGLFFSL